MLLYSSIQHILNKKTYEFWPHIKFSSIIDISVTFSAHSLLHSEILIITKTIRKRYPLPIGHLRSVTESRQYHSYFIYLQHLCYTWVEGISSTCQFRETKCLKQFHYLKYLDNNIKLNLRTVRLYRFFIVSVFSLKMMHSDVRQIKIIFPDSEVHSVGAHLGPVGPRWAPCWPHKPCYQGLLCGHSKHFAYPNDH